MTDPLLLIEDTPSLQLIYESLLKSSGHTVHVEGTAEGGLSAFQQLKPRVVLLDLMLPDGDGLDVMAKMLALAPGTTVIVITANGSINQAMAAVRGGAHEFLIKPFNNERFLSIVEKALKSQGYALPAPEKQVTDSALSPLIGGSQAMKSVLAKIRSVAQSTATVFITGESGTGKELCAQAIHQLSNRAAGPFIALNCGAIPADLLESEVFGHIKGSFTGAISDKVGAAGAADGGTLFFDEICEMDLSLQTKLLRFLQTSTITPVGATKPRKVNVRILCATNRDPAEAVKKGRFREDLYYRLHVIPIAMPPLRERGEDVVEIAEANLLRLSAEEGRAFTGFDPAVAELFRRLTWPGNVRQLLNVLWNVVVLNEGPIVTLAMLPTEILNEKKNMAVTESNTQNTETQTFMDSIAGKTLAEIEQAVIEETIRRNGGSIPRAARELDVSPSTIYRKREGWIRKGTLTL